MNEIDGYIGDLTSDKKAPSVAKLEVSNITDTGFTLIATGKDNVAVAKYEFYIKNGDGSFTLEKTIETEDTTVIYDVTGIDLKQNSYTYKLKVYDKAGNSKESSELLIEAVDNNAPTVATLVASDVTDNGFTLTAIAEDDRGIVKYEFYIKGAGGNFKLERTMEVSGNTATYVVTGKTPRQSSYEYKVIAYDKAGNSKESDVISVGVKKLYEGVKIGDYVDYDAGVWTQEDLDKITSSTGNPTLHSTVNDTITGNQEEPTIQGEFGDFEIGQSRNKNVKHVSNDSTNGWRVWDIDSNTGVVTLVSAGIPKSFYDGVNTGQKSVNILKNRDCTMYVNKFATDAHILTGEEYTAWYNKRFSTNYTLVENPKNSTMIRSFSLSERDDMLCIGVRYYLATLGHYSQYFIYSAGPNSFSSHDNVIIGSSNGIRIIVSLSSAVLLESDTGDGTVSNPWKIVQN